MDKKVGGLGRARKVYFTLPNTNGNTTTRIGFKAAHGFELVRRERLMMSLFQMIHHQIIPLSSTPPLTSPTHEDILIHGLVELRSRFFNFREKVREDL